MPSKKEAIKFVLISPYEEIHSCGVRAISSYLKSKGIRVKIIFCPLQSRFDVYFRHRVDSILPDSIIRDIIALSHDATCIGISLMTDHFKAVSILTGELKNTCLMSLSYGVAYILRSHHKNVVTMLIMFVLVKGMSQSTNYYNH